MPAPRLSLFALRGVGQQLWHYESPRLLAATTTCQASSCLFFNFRLDPSPVSPPQQFVSEATEELGIEWRGKDIFGIISGVYWNYFDDSTLDVRP